MVFSLSMSVMHTDADMEHTPDSVVEGRIGPVVISPDSRGRGRRIEIGHIVNLEIGLPFVANLVGATEAEIEGPGHMVVVDSRVVGGGQRAAGGALDESLAEHAARDPIFGDCKAKTVRSISLCAEHLPVRHRTGVGAS